MALRRTAMSRGKMIRPKTMTMARAREMAIKKVRGIWESGGWQVGPKSLREKNPGLHNLVVRLYKKSEARAVDWEDYYHDLGVSKEQIRARAVEAGIARRKGERVQKAFDKVWRLKVAGADLDAAGIRGIEPGIYKLAREAFGGWRQFLEAAGIDPDEYYAHGHWSDRKVVKLIKARYESCMPLSSKATDVKSGLARYARQYFGSWENALRAAGLDLKDVRNRNWAIYTLERKLGKGRTSKLFETYGGDPRVVADNVAYLRCRKVPLRKGDDHLLLLSRTELNRLLSGGAGKELIGRLVMKPGSLAWKARKAELSESYLRRETGSASARPEENIERARNLMLLGNRGIKPAQVPEYIMSLPHERFKYRLEERLSKRCNAPDAILSRMRAALHLPGGVESPKLLYLHKMLGEERAIRVLDSRIIKVGLPVNTDTITRNVRALVRSGIDLGKIPDGYLKLDSVEVYIPSLKEKQELPLDRKEAEMLRESRRRVKKLTIDPRYMVEYHKGKASQPEERGYAGEAMEA